MAGFGLAKKGLGKAYKDYVKYQKGKVRQGPLGYIDAVEKDILKTHEPGSKWVKEPNPIPTMKKIAKASVAAPIVVVGAGKGIGKVKEKLKKRKEIKENIKRAKQGPSGKK
jgi:hypothetical protein